MKRLESSAVLVLTAMLCLPWPVASQAPAAGPQMTPAEREAYDMSLQMAFVCNPQRHVRMTSSESTITRAAGSLEGSASYLRSAEGTFLVLEGYNENQAGHCLVFAWFGGDLQPGSYEIRQLSMTGMEEEVGTPEHSFFTFSAVRAPDESATLVTQDGTLEVEVVAQDRVTGHFQLNGFTVNSQERVDGVTLEGSFSARAAEM
jgi:hypothetical protein